MTTVAFIGLGAMGSRMAANLISAGYTIRAWNRDKAKAKPLVDKGATLADSPAHAARGAAFVVSIVADDAATRAVMLGEAGVIAAAARGVSYLDSPVSGSLPQAQGKELVFMVGGDKAVFDKAQPVFAAMGRLAKHMGAMLLAQEVDRPAPIASLVRSQYQAARHAQLGKLDSAAIFLYATHEKPK